MGHGQWQDFVIRLNSLISSGEGIISLILQIKDVLTAAAQRHKASTSQSWNSNLVLPVSETHREQCHRTSRRGLSDIKTEHRIETCSAYLTGPLGLRERKGSTTQPTPARGPLACVSLTPVFIWLGQFLGYNACACLLPPHHSTSSLGVLKYL